MKIWFVSFFENTPLDDNKNTRYNSLVAEANNRNHEVIFWSSTFRHNVKQQRFEDYKETIINDKLKVNFIPAVAYLKNISFKRMFSHYRLSKSIIDYFQKETALPDVIIIAFPPISTAYEIVKWGKAKNIPVVIDIIDPWPDAFIEHFKGAMGTIAKFGIYPLRKKTSFVFNHCSAIMAISKQYIDWAKTYNPKVVNTDYFYPAVDLDEMKNQLKAAKTKITKEQNTFTVIYAGSLGYSYDIATILKAAAKLEENSVDAIKFIIAGDGPQKDVIEEYLNTHSNLEYLGRVSKEKLMEEYYKADIGLTQHIKGATQSVTYKLFDLLACGLPIMNSLESEMRNIILDNKVGFHNSPADSNELADNIMKCYNDKDLLFEMKERAIRLTENEGDSKVVYSKALNFIESQVKNN